jgi:hypothetical protein
MRNLLTMEVSAVFTLKEEHRLRVVGRIFGPKKEEVAGG